MFFQTAISASDFYLDGPYNKGTLRFDVDNDADWKKDSNFRIQDFYDNGCLKH